MLLGVVGEQADRAVAVPELERRRLMLALAVGLLHLEHDVGAVGRDRGRDELGRDAPGKRLAEHESPALGDQTGAGQR